MSSNPERQQTYEEYKEKMDNLRLTPLSREKWASMMVKYYGGYNDGTRFERRESSRSPNELSKSS